MKILLLSDTHKEDHITQAILQRWHHKVDACVHLGDSLWSSHAALAQQFDIVMRGNHDRCFLQEKRAFNAFLCHGHNLHVTRSLQEAAARAKQLNCSCVWYGHTHIPSCCCVDEIICINPGSVAYPRWSYNFGSYAIITYTQSQNISVVFYNAITHIPLTQKHYQEARLQRQAQMRAASQIYKCNSIVCTV